MLLVSNVGEVVYMGLIRLGLSTIVNNRLLCVWIIHVGYKPNE